MKIRITVMTLVLILVSAFLIGCGDGSSAGGRLPEEGANNPTATIDVDGYGKIVVELYPTVAPNTVNNFISLAESGFYDGNTIHRVDPGFVLQGGDPTGKGGGNPGYYIKGEFSENGFDNPLKHTKGVISMARSKANDSAGCQFFIMLDANATLDGRYAAFGKVISGMEVLDDIELREQKYVLDDFGTLSHTIKINSVTVDKKGVDYPAPEKIK